MPKTNLATKKANYELFHSSNAYFARALMYAWETTADDVRSAFSEGDYQPVHTFALPAEDVAHQLEEIFCKSQNVDRRWRRSSPCRSTSVGDVVRVGTEYWIVAPQGFDLGWHD
jgi:hypothetical protein